MTVDGLRPVSAGTWTDEDGHVWTRRGTQTSVARARRLMREDATRVLRTAGPGLEEVDVAAREAYWQGVVPYLEGRVRRAPGTKTDDHADCQVAEFRDAQRRTLLIFQEDC